MCWSSARVHLGLSDEQFYCLTPRQFHILMMRYQEQTEHSELLAGIITSTGANFSFCAPEKKLVPADFMPSRMNRRSARKQSSKIKQQVAANSIRAFLQFQTEARSKCR